MRQVNLFWAFLFYAVELAEFTGDLELLLVPWLSGEVLWRNPPFLCQWTWCPVKPTTFRNVHFFLMLNFYHFLFPNITRFFFFFSAIHVKWKGLVTKFKMLKQVASSSLPFSFGGRWWRVTQFSAARPVLVTSQHALLYLPCPQTSPKIPFL